MITGFLTLQEPFYTIFAVFSHPHLHHTVGNIQGLAYLAEGLSPIREIERLQGLAPAELPVYNQTLNPVRNPLPFFRGEFDEYRKMRHRLLI